MQMTNSSVGLLALSLLFPAMSAAQPQQWAIKGNFAESCSCAVTCPCNFGSEPTHSHCDANALVEIEKGHYGGVKLDGVSVVFAYRLGDWVKYYVGEKASDEQTKAAVDLLERAKLTEGAKVLSTQQAKIAVERTKTLVKFSVPESIVEIELMKGLDGKPIKIENLPSAFLVDYTQYKSIINRHTSKDKSFDYTGTNGIVARIDASGS